MTQRKCQRPREDFTSFRPRCSQREFAPGLWAPLLFALYCDWLSTCQFLKARGVSFTSNIPKSPALRWKYSEYSFMLN